MQGTRSVTGGGSGLPAASRSTRHQAGRTCMTPDVTGCADDQVLARAGIFQGVEADAVSALSAQLQPVHYSRGHIMFAEGEPGDHLYIIMSGKGEDRPAHDGRP
jgi:hypothetical protein